MASQVHSSVLQRSAFSRHETDTQMHTLKIKPKSRQIERAYWMKNVHALDYEIIISSKYWRVTENFESTHVKKSLLGERSFSSGREILQNQ